MYPAATAGGARGPGLMVPLLSPAKPAVTTHVHAATTTGRDATIRVHAATSMHRGAMITLRSGLIMARVAKSTRRTAANVPNAGAAGEASRVVAEFSRVPPAVRVAAARAASASAR